MSELTGIEKHELELKAQERQRILAQIAEIRKRIGPEMQLLAQLEWTVIPPSPMQNAMNSQLGNAGMGAAQSAGMGMSGWNLLGTR